ncbi:KAP family P-loop NTPase fold protein [Psychromonas algicola]|uniref:KAP family P-loop NTPase fold protein n=1 Tax=Psychromonas algicola TaxID=2555642 RepID=UPI0010672606|nr:P-loop NTPase fold protein [Psychromonas sp. RZ5]TEW52868.1 NTPase [Psychromonas sp. RZ5]
MGNAQPYTFSWDSETTHEGITYPVDTLDRARYASFLTNFLIAEASHGGYVLNINAPWGTGKTYFLNRWLINLKEEHPVVYIDAWKQDFSNDPMLSVVSSIISQLKEFQPIEAKTIGNTAGKVGGFIKDIAPIVAKGVMKKATGIDLNDDGEHDLSKADGAMLGDIAAKVTDKMIKNHNSTLNSITTFKKAIQEWIGAIQGNSKLSAPAFIFIDELDRCRPTYAVQMLEVIKHFFEMDNIIFVVATDTEQLQYAVKAVYGQGFEAQTYLGRFFNRRCTLQSVSKSQFITNFITHKFKLTKSVFEKWETWPQLRGIDDFVSLINQMEQVYDYSLRDLEQLIDKVIAVILISNKKINLIFLIYLFMLHDRDKRNYAGIINPSKLQISNTVDTNNLEPITHQVINFVDKYVFVKSEEPFFSIQLKDLLSEIYNSFNEPPHLREQNRRKRAERFYDRASMGSVAYKKHLLLIEMYKNDDVIDDYKNWVELAVSFDA